MKTVKRNLKTRQEFKNYIEQNKNIVVIVKVSATWCGPCKKVEPYITELYENTPKNIIMVELDGDDDDDTVAYLKIRKFPTFISYVHGEKTDIYETSQPNEIKEFFNKAIAHTFFT
uniref:Thioredoxin domain-containing protein n=1 Tax=viral metagenome TaxID=1070528 RepID=A0A6C0KFE2_9ZZZZ